MNKKIKQLLAGILLACMMAVVTPAQLLVSMAASGKITFSDPQGEVGQEVTVNMKISSTDGSLGSADVMLSYDASALEFVSGNSVEGGAGSLRAHGGPDAGDLSSIVFSMKFKVLKAANSQITIASQEVYDNNSQAVSISHLGNSTVSAGGNGAAAPAAADGLLTALSVAPGTLSPAFSPSVDSYSVSVGLDVERIDVQAAAVEGASVAVEGSEGLQMGENTVTIKVTAADGITVKNYTISVTKSEGGETAAASEAETEAVTGVSLEAAAKAITILAPEEGVSLPEAFTETTIDIDGHKVTGWIWAAETEHQYCIFYAMNAAGEKNFYRYDLTEKTIQRYFSDPAAESGYTKEETDSFVENYNSLLKDYKIRLYVIIALAAVSVVLLAIVIVLLASRNSHRDTRDSRREEEKRDSEERGSRQRMSREERYMLGEEDEEEAVEPTPSREKPVRSERAAAPETPDPRTRREQRSAAASKTAAEAAVTDARRAAGSGMAPSEAAAGKQESDRSDFEFAFIEEEDEGRSEADRRTKQTPVSDRYEEPVSRSSRQEPAAVSQPEELDDDFEFIDLDL